MHTGDLDSCHRHNGPGRPMRYLGLGVTVATAPAYCESVPKSQVWPTSRRGRPGPGRSRPHVAISSRDPSGLPDIVFPADVTGSARPDFVGEELDFVVATPDAAELSRLTLRFERGWATTAALDAWGFNTTKALAAHIRIQRGGAWSLDMQTADGPPNASQALLVVELVNVLVPPNSIALTPPGTPPGGFSAIKERAASVPPEGMIEAIEFLARLEAYLGEPVAVPDTFSPESFNDLSIAAELLSGATVRSTWDQMSWPMTAAHARELGSGPLSEGAAHLDRDWTVSLDDGREYAIGPITAHLHSVRVKSWPYVTSLPDDAPVAVVLEPADRERAIDLRFKASDSL